MAHDQIATQLYVLRWSYGRFGPSLRIESGDGELGNVHTIECFHSRGQYLCKFIGTKESVCIRKEFNSQRIGLGHQHGHRFIVLGHQYGRRDVMSKHSILDSFWRRHEKISRMA